jgi:hypothetical protein
LISLSVNDFAGLYLPVSVAGDKYFGKYVQIDEPPSDQSELIQRLALQAKSSEARGQQRNGGYTVTGYMANPEMAGTPVAAKPYQL